MTHMPGVPVKFDEPGEWKCPAMSDKMTKRQKDLWALLVSAFAQRGDSPYACVEHADRFIAEIGRDPMLEDGDE